MRPPRMSGFHLFDGWFFSRDLDGTVHITKYESAVNNANEVVYAEIPANQWESVIAHVSAVPGDYDRARKFHETAGIPAIAGGATAPTETEKSLAIELLAKWEGTFGGVFMAVVEALRIGRDCAKHTFGGELAFDNNLAGHKGEQR